MRIRKSHIIIGSSFLAIVIILVAVQYVHFRGIEDTLERLVEQRTRGQYKLFLGETKYDFFKLDFILKDARIYRIDTLNKKRVYYVDLPSVRINLGSLDSYLDFKQITVKEFVIEEPSIVLQKESGKKQRLNISSELVQVLRMIRELLDNFNIHSFKIIRGKFTLHKGSDQLRIRLVDFLAHEWNIRKLVGESQILIQLGQQEIDIFSHRLSFREVEYSYLKRQFRISDFAYHHVDTLSGARLDIGGGALVIDHIDWNELFKEEQYKLKKIKLENANIRGAFPVAGKKKNTNLFKVMHDVVGEIAIDSVSLQNVDVRLAYKQVVDSTSVAFQNASFSVTDFRLLNTPESFHVSEVRFNLDQTRVVLGNSYEVLFDSLFYNRRHHHQLSVLGLQIAERHGSVPFLQSRYLYMTDFDPYEFLLNRHFRAVSLEMNDVYFDVPPTRQKIKTKSSTGEIKVDLGRLNLMRVKINYADEGKQVSLTDLNLALADIKSRKDESPFFNFKKLDVGLVEFLDIKKNDRVAARQIAVGENDIRVAEVLLTQPGKLSLELTRLKIGLDTLMMRIPDRLPLVHIGKARVSGLFPRRGSQNKELRFPKMAIDQFRLDTMSVNLRGAAQKLNAHILDCQLDDIRIDSTTFDWRTMKTMVPSFVVEDSLWVVKALESKMSSSTPWLFRNLSIVKKDSSTNLRAKSLALTPAKDLSSLSAIKLNQISVKTSQKGFSAEAKIDSLYSDQLLIKPKPALGALRVFHPVVQIRIDEVKGRSQQAKGLHLPASLQALFVERAEAIIQHRKSTYAVHEVNLSWKQDELPLIKVDSVSTSTSNESIVMRQVELAKGLATIGKLNVTPLVDAIDYGHVGFERDWLKLNFKAIQLKTFNIDSLLSGRRIALDSVSLGAFRIDVLRDKRLPDPPYFEKELFSRKLYCLNKPIEISKLFFSNGEVYLQQISDKTNERGYLDVTSIRGELTNLSSIDSERNPMLEATGQIYKHGEVKVKYEIQGIDRFTIDITATDLDLPAFNKIVQPLESVSIKSGKLNLLRVTADANNHFVVGDALLRYEKLKIKIAKSKQTAFRNEVISVLANELIRNRRNNVVATLYEERNKRKAEFTYWVKIAVKGAANAARHGKKRRKKVTS